MTRILRTPGLARRTFELDGWGSPYPVQAEFASRAEIEVCRSIIASQVDLFRQPIEMLEERIAHDPAQIALVERHKPRPQFSLDVRKIASPLTSHSLSAATPGDSGANERMTLDKAPLEWLLARFSRKTRVLAIGQIDLSEIFPRALADRFELKRVAANEGQTRPALVGAERWRAAENSFASWIANARDDERREVGVYALSRDAATIDIEILRHRLWPHQVLLLPSGHPLLETFTTAWDGKILAGPAWTLLIDPGLRFLDPVSFDDRAPGKCNWPKISVVTVSYNQAAFLPACLSSVLGQGYPNLEYIVIDACSTDGSREILEQNRKRIDRLVIEPDKGQSDGLNKGFALATGEILTWINSDDMLAPGALKRAAMAFQSYSADIVVGNCERIGQDGSQIRALHLPALPILRPVELGLAENLAFHDTWQKSDYFFQPEVIFTSEIWHRSGGYLKQHLYWAMDLELWMRMAMAGARVLRIPDTIGRSRIHPMQKTTRGQLYLYQVRNILLEYDDALAAIERAAADLPDGQTMLWIEPAAANPPKRARRRRFGQRKLRAALSVLSAGTGSITGWLFRPNYLKQLSDPGAVAAALVQARNRRARAFLQRLRYSYVGVRLLAARMRRRSLRHAIRAEREKTRDPDPARHQEGGTINKRNTA